MCGFFICPIRVISYNKTFYNTSKPPKIIMNQKTKITQIIHIYYTPQITLLTNIHFTTQYKTENTHSVSNNETGTTFSPLTPGWEREWALKTGTSWESQQQTGTPYRCLRPPRQHSVGSCTWSNAVQRRWRGSSSEPRTAPRDERQAQCGPQTVEAAGRDGGRVSYCISRTEDRRGYDKKAIGKR